MDDTGLSEKMHCYNPCLNEEKSGQFGIAKECLLYQGMHFIPVGAKGRERGEERYLPVKKISNDEKEIDRLQKVQKQTGFDVFFFFVWKIIGCIL